MLLVVKIPQNAADWLEKAVRFMEENPPPMRDDHDDKIVARLYTRKPLLIILEKLNKLK